MAETMMKMPALAVVGADHRIVRSTESFRQRYAGAQAACEESPELDQVLTGRADTAVVSVGELSVEIQAVTDAAGRRQAMLSLPVAEPVATPDPPISALREAAGESQAIVWVKDLDGRYLYANSRYLHDLETSEERLRGNTDEDLPEAETVDGPRRRYAQDGLEEPLQLEYTVPEVDHRPALAAFRFPLCDDRGQPIGTCGVAAPVNEAQIARDEAVRLMQLERWNRLDPMDVRAELLEQWHVQTALGGGVESGLAEPSEDQNTSSGEAELEAVQDVELARQWADRADQFQGELREARDRVAEMEADAQQLRAAAQQASEEAERWRSELEQAHVELERAQAEMQGAQSEADAAQVELERAQADAQSAQSEVDVARVELERAQADARTAHSEADAARAELGAARAQAESLRGPSTAALRLSEELGRALASERERGDELERALARIRTRLSDFDAALERSPATQARAA